LGACLRAQRWFISPRSAPARTRLFFPLPERNHRGFDRSIRYFKPAADNLVQVFITPGW